MKILLLMCHYIGDTFWALQIMPEISKIYPNAEVLIGVKSRSFELVESFIFSDKIIILNNVISDRHREDFSLKEYFKEVSKVRKEKFDIAFDLSNNRYSAIFLKLTGIPNRVGISIHKFSFLYTETGPKFTDYLHLYKRPWHVLKAIKKELEIPEYLSPIPYKKELAEKIKEELNISEKDKVALLAPGAGWDSKRWDIKNFAECGKFLIKNGYRVIISGSTKELDLCTDLNNLIDNKGIVFIRKLNEFLALNPLLKIFLSNDSGPSHLMASFDVITFCVFTETNQDNYRPIGKNVFVIDARKETVYDVINLLSKKI